MRAVRLLSRNMHAWPIDLHSQMRTSLLHAVPIIIALHALRISTAGWGHVVVAVFYHQAARSSRLRQCVRWIAHVTLSFPESANFCLSPAM